MNEFANSCTVSINIDDCLVILVISVNKLIYLIFIVRCLISHKSQSNT